MGQKQPYCRDTFLQLISRSTNFNLLCMVCVHFKTGSEPSIACQLAVGITGPD